MSKYTRRRYGPVAGRPPDRSTVIAHGPIPPLPDRGRQLDRWGGQASSSDATIATSPRTPPILSPSPRPACPTASDFSLLLTLSEHSILASRPAERVYGISPSELGVSVSVLPSCLSERRPLSLVTQQVGADFAAAHKYPSPVYGGVSDWSHLPYRCHCRSESVQYG